MKRSRNPRNATGRCPENERIMPITRINPDPKATHLSGQEPAEGCWVTPRRCSPDGSTWEDLFERRKGLPAL
jgi:hypothetical protein